MPLRTSIAPLAGVMLLSGCMMIPMAGMMGGMSGHGGDAVGQGAGHGGHGDQPRDAAPSIAEEDNPLLARCHRPLAIAVVTDDSAAPGAAQARPFGLGAPSRIARALADASRCFLTLDPDPLLLAMAGGVHPDVMLRIRIERLDSSEASPVDRFGRALRSTYSRYLGGAHALERLERIEVTLQMVCAREKRVAAAYAGSAEGVLPEPPLLLEPVEAVGRENRERFAQAYARAQTAAVAALRLEPRPCG